MEGDYVFTEHFIERFKERFPYLELPWNDRWQLYKDLNRMIEHSHDERRYLNDTAYMFHLQETYGYDARYEFLVNEECNVLFVVSLNHGRRKIVKTCMPLNTCRKFIPNKKYQSGGEKVRKIPKKRSGSIFNELEAQEEYINSIGDSTDPIVSTNVSDITKTLGKGRGYSLILDKHGRPHAIKCLVCQSTSYHPDDIREKYCGCCHKFIGGQRLCNWK